MLSTHKNSKMKNLLPLFLLVILFSACHKNKSLPATSCDILEAYTDNATKVTITNGAWGTVSFMEGNCMPIVPPSPSGCTNCPVKRTVKIYEYTLLKDANRWGSSNIFFDSFNSRLVAATETDENGFFQAIIPAGKYTIAIVENGKLYANSTDENGGLSSFTLSGGRQNVNVTMAYKAVY
jgi:hypothetical protein